MRKILFVDGRNFIGKLKDVYKGAGLPEEKLTEELWATFDFKKLLNKVLEGVTINDAMFYFGKLNLHPETAQKSEYLIEQQRHLKTHLEKQGFKVVFAGKVQASKKN